MFHCFKKLKIYILSYTAINYIDITWYHKYQQKSWYFTSPFFNRKTRVPSSSWPRKKLLLCVNSGGSIWGVLFSKPTKLTRVYCCFVACDVSTYQFLWHIERSSTHLVKQEMTDWKVIDWGSKCWFSGDENLWIHRCLIPWLHKMQMKVTAIRVSLSWICDLPKAVRKTYLFQHRSRPCKWWNTRQRVG